MLSLSPQEIVAFLLAVGFAAGLNVYAATATLGLLSRAGMVALPGQLDAVESWWIIGLCLALWAVEFVADKIPAFDVFWNVGQWFVRVPVSAVLAYAGAADLGPGWQVAAAAAGAVVTSVAAGGKTAAHAAVAPSPEPLSNILLSLAEDAIAIGLIWFATAYPLLAASLVIIALVAIVALARAVYRVIQRRRAARRADSPPVISART